MDALVYAEINNNITDQELLQDLANEINITSSNLNDIQSKVNEYLDLTTIKRACCMGRAGPNKGDGSTGVTVKIPIPDGYNTGQDINKNMEDQFQFIEKTVYVPQEMCDAQWVKNQPYCDNFMNVYCSNQAKIFTDLNNGTFDAGHWKLYAKECSCYAPPNPSYASAPHICYMNGCSEGDPGVYVDPSSRGKQCDMTVCTSILNAAGIQAGGSANINSTVQQNCGSAIAKRAQEQASSAANQPVSMNTKTQSGTAVQPAPQLAPQPTAPESPVPTSEQEDFFTKYKTYIIIAIVVLVLCCCSSSAFILMRRR
jgi:hypothetical protein